MYVDLLEKVNFIKTSTKIDNNEVQWHQGSKRSTDTEDPKCFPYISKGNYNSVLKICTYNYAPKTQKDEIRQLEFLSKFSKYENI